MEDKPFSQEESLKLIDSMLHKAKKSHFETGSQPILWGSVIAFCSLFTFAQIKGWIDLPFSIWYLTILAVIPSVYLSIKEKKQTNAVHYEDKMTDSLWLIYGISIFVLVAILEIIHSKFAVKNLRDFSTAFFLLLYGFPTLVTGLGKKVTTMTIGGIVCWAGAILSLYTTVDYDMLITAFAAIMAWLIPGLIFRKRQFNV